LSKKIFNMLSTSLINSKTPPGCLLNQSILDSALIFTCSINREGKVPREITDNGFCSTNGIYFYVLKLHVLANNHAHYLPFNEQFQLILASENNLNLFKVVFGGISNRAVWGDNIYCDTLYFQDKTVTYVTN
jgi:hypothetical protein